MKTAYIFSALAALATCATAHQFQKIEPSTFVNVSAFNFDFDLAKTGLKVLDGHGRKSMAAFLGPPEADTVYKNVVSNGFNWVMAIGVGDTYVFRWVDTQCQAWDSGRWGERAACLAGWTAAAGFNGIMAAAWYEGRTVTETILSGSAVYAAAKGVDWYRGKRAIEQTFEAPLVGRGGYPGPSCKFDTPLAELTDLEGNYRFIDDTSVDVECQNLCANGPWTNPILKVDSAITRDMFYTAVQIMYEHNSGDTGIHVYDIGGNADTPAMYCRIRLYNRQILMCPDINVPGC